MNLLANQKVYFSIGFLFSYILGSLGVKSVSEQPKTKYEITLQILKYFTHIWMIFPTQYL